MTDLKTSVRMMFDAMELGIFTSKKLSDYLDGVDESDEEDLREFTNARRVINGTDRAAMIGKYALAFETALKAGGYTGEAAEEPPQKPIQSDPPPDAPTQPETPPSAWAAFFMAAIKAIAKALGGKK